MPSILSNNFKKREKEKLAQIPVFRKVLPMDELIKVGKRFMEFEAKEENKNKIFVYDKKAFLIIETPEALYKAGEEDQDPYNGAKNPKPKPDGTVNTEYFIWRNCKCKLGEVTVMGDAEIMNQMSVFGANVFASGRFNSQFTHAEDPNYDNACKSLNELIENYYEKEQQRAIKAGLKLLPFIKDTYDDEAVEAIIEGKLDEDGTKSLHEQIDAHFDEFTANEIKSGYAFIFEGQDYNVSYTFYPGQIIEVY